MVTLQASSSSLSPLPWPLTGCMCLTFPIGVCKCLNEDAFSTLLPMLPMLMMECRCIKRCVNAWEALHTPYGRKPRNVTNPPCLVTETAKVSMQEHARASRSCLIIRTSCLTCVRALRIARWHAAHTCASQCPWGKLLRTRPVSHFRSLAHHTVPFSAISSILVMFIVNYFTCRFTRPPFVCSYR
jgi:hypothetical protein